ncbi:dermonecrotic toxin domain-containing protein [Pseudomonas sp. NPDC089401]|uniref:dermonecrotic toxin domain-containing protein n=1 Tax=Pseudomonas sp. NPDC089401 TaxID=3364462 RepID=UPI003811FE9E
MTPIPLENQDLVRQVLQGFPRPDELAREKMANWLQQLQIEGDPQQLDVVTFHHQPGPAHTQVAVITQKMNLVEALLSNWQGESAAGYGGFHYGDWAGVAPTGPLTLVERLEPVSVFANTSPYLVFNGLYRRSDPPRYAPDTRLALRAEDFQIYIWSLHFHHSFKAKLDSYWASREAHYQQALRIAFLAACNQQLLQGRLSEAARQLAWKAAGVLPLGDTRLSMLNVYGYSSTSILRIDEGAQGRVLLYIPGNAAPLHAFDDAAHMKRWFAEQCRSEQTRCHLMTHFARADWPDGLDFSGLRTALTGLGLYPRAHRFGSNHPGFASSGFWDPQTFIDYQPEKYSPRLTGNLFEYLTLRQKQRAYADADSQITSNHDIDKTRWSNYLSLATALLAPLVIVFPELSPLLALGGLAQFSLALEQTINGKDLDTKAQGVSDQLYGLLNAAAVPGGVLAGPGGLYRYVRRGFFTPARLPEVLGRPLGAAPVAEEVELAEQVFHEQSVLSPHPVGGVVIRVDAAQQHRFMARLQTERQVIIESVEYEFATDSFICSREAGQANPPRWKATGRGDTPLRPCGPPQVATAQQRMATLQALGIDVKLPIDYAAFGGLQSSPIPKVVSSIWLGDQPVDGEFLEALSHNAQVLRDSGYRFQILLSRQHRPSYLLNLNTLRTQAPGALLMPLEDQGFFEDFQRSPYFAQYQAALSGGAPNPASACDILRYRLLHHQGGLYLDADDQLLLANKAGTPAPITRLTLKTTAKGLLLAPPVSNEQLGMFIQFNSSMIGSHPGNPTLTAFSDEMLRRFSLVPDFYARRPDPMLQPALFRRYGKRLSLLSGPAMFNAIIDEHLPALKQLREICNLLASPIHDLHAALDLSQFSQVMREQLPLDQIAKMGSAHSWARSVSRAEQTEVSALHN